MPATIAHIFTSPVADITGTVSIFDAAAAGSTATAAASNIVKPSNWNQTHAVTLAPTGQEIIGAFSNGGNVSFSTNPSGFVVATAPSGGAASVFSNANGISWGTNGSTITGTVKTDYMVSNAGSNFIAATGGVTGTNISGTIGSNGLQLSVANGGGGADGYNIIGVNGGVTQLSTTYQFSNGNNVSFGLNAGTITATASFNQTVDTNKAGTGFTSTTTVGTAVVATNNTNGLSMGVPQFITTAAQSNHSHGDPTLALTNINGTTASASNGLTLSLSAVVPAQTVQPVAVSGSNGSFAFSTLSVGNSNGLSFYTTNNSLVGSYTVPTQSAQTVGIYGAGNTTGQSSSSTIDARSISFVGAGIASVGMSGGSVLISAVGGGAGADGVNIIGVNGGATQISSTYQFSNGNNVSFGLNAGTITATATFAQSVQTQNMVSVQGSTGAISFGNANGITFGFNNSTITASHNALTTARASNDAVGLNTAGTNVTWTVNSSGISLNAGGYAGTGTTFAGTNVSGSMTVNSNGVNLALSAPSPGAGGAVNFSAGTTSGDLQSVVFANGNGVSFGLNAGTITGSVDAAGGRTFSLWRPAFGLASTSIAMANGGAAWVKMDLDYYLACDAVRVPIYVTCSSSAASSGQVGRTVALAFYTRAATNSAVLQSYFSMTHTISASYSSNASLAYGAITAFSNSTSYISKSSSSAGIGLSSHLHGVRNLIFPVDTTFTPGEYWVGLSFSVSTAGTSGNILNINVPYGMNIGHVVFGTNVNNLNDGFILGRWEGGLSTTTTAFPAITLTNTKNDYFAGANVPFLFVGYKGYTGSNKY